MKNLGRNIRAAREARGLTQAQLAVALGWQKVQGDYIGRIEKGRHTPKLETLTRIAEVLHVSVAELLADDPIPLCPAPTTHCGRRAA